MTANPELVRALEELQGIYSMLGQEHRATAYFRAIQSIKKLPLITQDNFDAVFTPRPAGVGPAILARAREFVLTGAIADLTALRADPRVVSHRELARVLGVGPATIAKWRAEGVTNLAGLRRAVAAGNIVLTHMQKLGLRYYNDLNTRIPRAEATTIAERVIGVIKSVDPHIIATVTGSYRRGAPTCGDVDMLITNREFFDSALIEKIMARISRDPCMVDVVSEGNERVTFLYKCAMVRQVDILHVEYGSYFTALNYFTGGYVHNEWLRGIAKRLGYRLNQAGLFRAGARIPITSEQDIYRILGVEYREPAARD